MKHLLLALVILIAGCVPTVTPTPFTPTPSVTVTPTPTAPTPFVSPPITPPPSIIITPLPPRPPLSESVVYTYTLKNPGLNRPYRVLGNGTTVADGWGFWFLPRPGYWLDGVWKVCTAGRPDCYVQCPLGCMSPGKTCTSSDMGCWWAQPEYAEAWYGDYASQRVMEGQSAQKTFTYGRPGEYGIYQSGITVKPASLLTFTVYAQAWQCFDYPSCVFRNLKVGVDDVKIAYYVALWKCTSYADCFNRNWVLSDLPYNMHIKVGIDPTGGTSPTATTVLWGPEGNSWDTWTPFSVVARTSTGRVTLFTHVRVDFDFARMNNDVYFDLASLTVEEDPLPASPTPTPTPTKTATPTNTPTPTPTKTPTPTPTPDLKYKVYLPLIKR